MSQGEFSGDGNSKANKLIKEFPEFTKRIELLMAEYEKLVETKATQLQEIDRLKALVADKDETIRLHEQRCCEVREEADALRMSLEQTKTEHDAKVAKLEKKLESKGKEVIGKSSNEVEGEANSMLNSMNMIKEKLKGLELEAIKTATLQKPKEQLQLLDNQERSRTLSRERRSTNSISRGRSCGDLRSEERRSTNSISRGRSCGDLRSEFLENGGKTRWPGAPKLSTISPHKSRDHSKSRIKPHEKRDDDLGNEERRSTNSISRGRSCGDLRSEFLENDGKTRWPGAPKLSTISPHKSRDHSKSRTKPHEKRDDDLGNELLKNDGKTLSPRPPGGEPKRTYRRSKKH